MEPHAPLETLFELERGEILPLAGELARVFAPLRLSVSARTAEPYIVGNMVTTLDGVVALNSAGHLSGGDISGFNPYDQAMVGLLRASADAVIVGAETFRVEARHFLTPEDIAPQFTEEYRALRAALGKSAEPCNVIISASGKLNLEIPLFQQNRVPVLVITTSQGADRLRAQTRPPSLRIEAVQDGQEAIAAETILQTVSRVYQGNLLLVEGGPRLMSAFIAEHHLNELFLTLAPQIAGRDGSVERPGFVKGQLFAPEQARWGELLSVKRGGDHLFLRYALEAQ